MLDRPVYLYIKIHNVTKLMYFRKTIIANQNKYYGLKRSNEVKLKMSNAMKGKKKINCKQIECPHCGKIGNMSAIKDGILIDVI